MKIKNVTTVTPARGEREKKNETAASANISTSGSGRIKSIQPVAPVTNPDAYFAGRKTRTQQPGPFGAERALQMSGQGGLWTGVSNAMEKQFGAELNNPADRSDAIPSKGTLLRQYDKELDTKIAAQDEQIKALQNQWAQTSTSYAGRRDSREDDLYRAQRAEAMKAQNEAKATKEYLLSRKALIGENLIVFEAAENGDLDLFEDYYKEHVTNQANRGTAVLGQNTGESWLGSLPAEVAYAQSSVRENTAKNELKKRGYTDEQILHYINARNGEGMDALIGDVKEFTAKHPIIAEAAKVATVPVRGIAGALGMMMAPGEKHTGYSLLNEGARAVNETETALMSTAIEATANRIGIQGKGAKTLGKLGTLIYSAADSALESAVAMGTGGHLGEVMLGLSAATDAYNEALDNGLPTGRAIVTGLFAGGFEALFEHLSLENLRGLSVDTNNIKSFIGRNGFINFWKSAFTEGSEEFFTDIANEAYDYLVNGGYSNFQRTVRDLMAEGMSEEKAKKQYAKEFGLQLAQDFAVGAMSGGMGFGSRAAVVNARVGTETSNIGRAVRQMGKDTEGGVQGVLKTLGSKETEGLTDKSGSYKVGRATLKALDDYENRFRRTVKTTAEQAGTENTVKQIDGMLQEAGLHESEAGKVAQAYVDFMTQDKVAYSTLRTIATNDAAVEYINNQLSNDSYSAVRELRNKILETASEGRINQKIKKKLEKWVHADEFKRAEAQGEVLKKSADAVQTGETAQLITESVKASTADGQVQVKGIAGLEDGKIKVTVDESGATDDLDNITFDETKDGIKGRQIYTAVADMMRGTGDYNVKMSATAANLVIALAQNTDTPVDVFLQDAYEAYKAGTVMRSRDTVEVETDYAISNKEIEAMYAAGAAEYKVQKGVTRIGTQKMTEAQTNMLQVLDRFFQTHELSLIVVDNLWERTRLKNYRLLGANYTDTQGTDVIVIALNAGRNQENVLDLTAYHELFHWLKKQGQDGRQAAQEMIDGINEGAKAKDPDGYREMVDELKEVGYTADEIAEEIACQYIGTLMSAESFRQQTANDEEAAAAWGDSLPHLKDFYDGVRGYIKQTCGYDKRVQTALEEDVDTAAAWVARFEGTLSYVQAQGGAGNGGETKFSVAMTKEAEEKVIRDSADLIKKSLAFAESGAHEKLIDEAWTDAATLPKSTATERYRKIIDIWKKIGGNINSEFLNAWDKKVGKDRAFEIFKAQSGYKYNAELASMCKKGIALFDAIDVIVKERVIEELGIEKLGKHEKEILYDILKNHGHEIPCAICYVEQARQREGTIIRDFVGGNKAKKKLGWNQALDKIEERMQAQGVNYEFGEIDIAAADYTPADAVMSATEQNAFYNAVYELVNEEIENANKTAKKKRTAAKAATPQAINAALKGSITLNMRVYKSLVNELQSRYRLPANALYSSVATQNIAKGNHELYKTFNMQGGVSGYKTKQTPIVYWGDILKMTDKPAAVRKAGGIRWQSNSDFQMYTFLDRVQYFLDMTAKGYYHQEYTKVPAALKLFGLMRGKQNASLIPAVHIFRNADGSINEELTRENAGLDENGEPIYDKVEGIDPDEAFMIAMDREYSKSVGTICVAYSDNHIWKLLDDERVSMIIGFHDKTDNPEKRYRGARYAHNYNGENEAKNAKGETVHVDFSSYIIKAENKFKKTGEAFTGTTTFNGKTYTADDIPKLAADIYLSELKAKGWTPAYEKFAGHENYYKLLADFRLVDAEGHYAPHRPVQFYIPETVPVRTVDGNGNVRVEQMDTEEYIQTELEKEMRERDAIARDLADTSEDGIIPQFKKAIREENKSLSRALDAADAEYQEAAQAERDLKEQYRRVKDMLQNSAEYQAYAEAIAEKLPVDVLRPRYYAYKQLETDSGVNELNDKLYDAYQRVKRAEEERERIWKEDRQEEEAELIRKSGLPENEYFEKAAVKMYGYTTDFNEAGYMLPNGKMLNFSGEYGQHPGMRGEDHRGIGGIFPSAQGAEAMNRFISYGNIRVMAEAPGVDISAQHAPTNAQYGQIMDMVRNSARSRYFSVDFSNEDGSRAGYLQYEGSFSPTKVINDIKHYYETGEIRGQSDLQRFRYSYAGVGSKTADMLGLEIAKGREEAGEDSETIRIETGWFRGMDGKWRYEIDNTDYFLNETAVDRMFDDFEPSEEAVRLEDFIDHPAIFEAYPFLKDVRVVAINSQKYGGYWNNDNNTIALSRQNMNSYGAFSNVKSTVIHEIQHAIQNYEAFAAGTSPEWWESMQSNWTASEKAQWDKLRKNVQAAYDYGDSLPYAESKAFKFAVNIAGYIKRGWKVSDQERTQHEEYVKGLDAEGKKYFDVYVKYIVDEANLFNRIRERQARNTRELYMRTAGEIEARDVEDRLDLREDERRQKRPDIDSTDVVFADYSRALDDEYMAAVEAGDTEKAQEMVDEAAKKAGYKEIGYHGTDAEPFYVFDTARPFGKTGGYFSSNDEIWPSYGKRLIKAYLDPGKQKVIDLNGERGNRHDIPGLAKQAKAEGYDSLLVKNTIHAGNAHYREFQMYIAPMARINAELAFGRLGMVAEALNTAKAYDDLEVALLGDYTAPSIERGRTVASADERLARAETWNQIRNSKERLAEAEKEASERDIRAYNLAKFIAGHLEFDNPSSKYWRLLALGSGREPDVYGTLPRFVELKDINNLTKEAKELAEILRGQPRSKKIVAALEAIAKYGEYAAPILEQYHAALDEIVEAENNPPDYAFDDMTVVFSSNQIKLADPVTYDDEGNVIPLSERFNPENKDIRYSRSIDEQIEDARKAKDGTDLSYLIAIKDGRLDTARQIIEAVAKEHGYNILAYHGTRQQFTEFSRKYQGANYNGFLQYGAGFYFSPSGKEAKTWAERSFGDDDVKIMNLYLSSDNLLGIDALMPEAYEKLQREGMSEADARWYASKAYRYIQYLFDEKGYNNLEVQEELMSMGYDAIGEVYNSTGKTTGQYVVFHPEQIKSSDVIVRDDNGDIILPSERFDPAKTDIRYSRVVNQNAVEYVERLKSGSRQLWEMIDILEDRANEIASLREYMGAAPLDMAALRRIAKKYNHSFDHSKAYVESLAMRLAKAQEMLATGANVDTVLYGLYKIAEKEWQDTGHWEVVNEDAQEFIDYLRPDGKMPVIYVDESTYSSIAAHFKGRKAFRDRIAGKFVVTTDEKRDGTKLDDFYTAAQDQNKFPLEDTIDPGEQMENMLAIYESGLETHLVDTAKDRNLEGETLAERATDDAFDMLREMLFPKGMVDKARKQLENSRPMTQDQWDLINMTDRLDKLQEYVQTERRRGIQSTITKADEELQKRLEELSRSGKTTVEIEIERDRLKQEYRMEALRRAYAQRIESVREYYKEQAQKEAMRRDIKRNLNALMELFNKERDSQHVPEVLKKTVLGFLAMFDKDRSLITAANMHRIAEFADEIKDVGEDEIPQEYAQMFGRFDEDIRADINELIKKIEKIETDQGIRVHSSMLSLDDMRVLNNTAEHIRFLVESANEAFVDGKRKKISAIAESIIARAKTVTRNKLVRTLENNKIGKKVIKAEADFMTKMLTPINLFDEKIGGAMADVYEGFRNGQDEWFRRVAEGKNVLDKAKKDYRYKDWKDKTIHFSFPATLDRSAWEVDMPIEAVLQIYATLERERRSGNDTAHLLEGGVVLSDDLTEANGLLKSLKDTTGKKVQARIEAAAKKATEQVKANKHTLSWEELLQITQHPEFTKEMKDYADEIVKYMSTDVSRYGNEATMALSGIRKFNEEYYFPFQSAKDYLYTRLGVSDDTRLKNAGFTKRVKHGANTPLILSGFTSVAANHIQQMALFSTMTVPIDTLQRVINYQQVSLDEKGKTIPGEDNVKTALKNAYGEAVMSYINTFVTQVNGGIRTDPLDSLWNKGTSMFKRAAVMGNMSVVVQQPTALMRGMAIIDPKYIFGKASKADYKDMLEHAPIAGIKEQGGFDTGTGRGAVAWMLDEATPGQRITELWGKPAAIADAVAWTNLWNACKRETRDKHPELEYGSDAFYDTTYKRFRDIVDYTQVYDSTLSKNELMRGAGGLTKMVTAFMAEPSLSLNMLMMSGKGRKINKGRALAAFAANIIVNSMFKAIVAGWRDKDEDESYSEKWLEHFVSDLVGDKNVLFLDGAWSPVGMVPWVKDILSLWQGYNVDRSDISAISDLIEAAKGVGTAFDKFDGTWQSIDLEAIADFAGSISAITPMPMGKAIQGVLGITRVIFNKTVRPFEISWETARQTALEGMGFTTANAEKAYDAAIRNNTEYIRRQLLPDEEKIEQYIAAGNTPSEARANAMVDAQQKWENAVKNGILAKDERAVQAAEARYNGETNRYELLVDEMEADGLPRNSVIGAIKSLYDAMKPDEAENKTMKDKSLYTTEDLDRAVRNNDLAAWKHISEELMIDGTSEETITKKATDYAKELVADGDEKSAKQVLTTFAGMSNTTAAAKVKNWKNPDGLSADAWYKYYDEVASSGISADVFERFWTADSAAKGEDKNGDGKADNGTKKAEQLKIIDSLPITSEQKDVLYRLHSSWSESKLSEAPWHK